MSDSFPLWISHVAYPEFSDWVIRNVSHRPQGSVGMEHADGAGQPEEGHNDQSVSKGQHHGIGEHASDCLSKRKGNHPVTLGMKRKGRANAVGGGSVATQAEMR